jgi:hypothetical protein
MSIVIQNNPINYGNTTTILVYDLTNVTVTPINSVVSSIYKNNIYTIIVNPLTSTQYTINGITFIFEDINLYADISVNVYANFAVNNSIIYYDLPYTINAYGGSNNYTWYPSTYLNTITGNVVITQPLNNITYTITATDIFKVTSTYNFSIIISKTGYILFDPTQLTIYEGNLAIITANSVFANNKYYPLQYIWRPTTSKYLPDCAANLQYGQTIKINPYNTITYDVTGNNNILTSYGSYTIKVIPKSIEMIDTEVLPQKLYQLIIQRNSKELKKELLKDLSLSKRIINFYYTTLQTAYRMEWTNKNGNGFTIKWITVYQINNEASSMILNFTQLWKFFQYINQNQTRAHVTKSNFAFLLNNINQLFLENPQIVYYIQQ